MTLEKFRFDNKRPIRKAIHDAFDKADRLHEMEQDLIKTLRIIDSQRYFVYVGYKSLLGFCDHALRFSRTQSYRIVTLVRRPSEAQHFSPNETSSAIDDPCTSGPSSTSVASSTPIASLDLSDTNASNPLIAKDNDDETGSAKTSRSVNANFAGQSDPKSGIVMRDEGKDREEDSLHRWPSENYSGKYGGPW